MQGGQIPVERAAWEMWPEYAEQPQVNLKDIHVYMCVKKENSFSHFLFVLKFLCFSFCFSEINFLIVFLPKKVLFSKNKILDKNYISYFSFQKDNIFLKWEMFHRSN